MQRADPFFRYPAGIGSNAEVVIDEEQTDEDVEGYE
jgi:hypothetical protein